ncbi:MAG: tetratricopeptide repeat protein [Candidatus Riflebacteria bacterium]|nr:tetratricopeptide repeat protein [Candidatus Riflebacteria bacterium]
MKKTKFWVLLSAFALFALLLLPADARERATTYISKGIRLKASGDLAEAAENFEQALYLASNKTEKSLAAFMLGDTKVENGDYAEAAALFEEFIALGVSPEEKAEACYKLVHIHTATGNHEKARNWYSIIQSENPQSPYLSLAANIMKTAGQALPAPVKKQAIQKSPSPKEPQKPSTPPVQKAEPEKVAVQQPQAPRTSQTEKPQAPKTASQPSLQPVQQPVAAPKSVSSDTAALIAEALYKPSLTADQQARMITEILSLQDQQKELSGKSGEADVIMKLAAKTSEFGEILEACKLYDSILTAHQTSPHVEEAYYQSIRHRALLGLHDAVSAWGKAFVAGFPASSRAKYVVALMEYAKAEGKIDIAEARKNVSAAKKAEASAAAKDSLSLEDADALLKKNPAFQKGLELMKNAEYEKAMQEFEKLEAAHAQAPALWWNKSLIYIQNEDFSEAEKTIYRLLRLDPANEDAKSLLGYTQYRQENYGGASATYEELDSTDEDGIDFYDSKTASERLKKEL